MTRSCPNCFTRMPDRFPEGLCPRCLLGAAVPRIRSAKRQNARPEIEELKRWFPELEIIGLLGEGGMGTVYQARQPRLDRRVALKIMTAGAGDGEEFALRFEREAQALARLNHPHIVAIHDFGEIGSERTGGRPMYYFLMEHVDGPDLASLMRSGAMDQESSLAIVTQICDALQHAHDYGVIHRDIKPGNILLDAAGNVRVTDFGLAKVGNGEEGTTGLTRTGSSMGTIHYTAPEQWDHPESVDHRADLFALGVVLYEMLTGERPVGFFKPPSHVTACGSPLDAVVMKAMARDPEQRYQQAREIRDDIARLGGRSRWFSRSRLRFILPCVLAAFIAAVFFLAARRTTGLAGGESSRPVSPPLTDLQQDHQPTYRLVMIPTETDARETNPGAPWEVERNDLIDLQVSETNTNGYRGAPLDHGVIVALTHGGKLLDWIHTIPGESIIPAELRDAEVEKFSIYSENNRSVAMLTTGEVLAWSWKVDPEGGTVRVSAVEKLDFGRADRPSGLRACGYQTILAIYEDGSIGRVSMDMNPIEESRLEGRGKVVDINFNFIALLDDGSILDLAVQPQLHNGVDFVEPSGPGKILRPGAFFPTAVMDDGRPWFWNEAGSDSEETFLALVKRASIKGRIADIRTYQCGDMRFAVKNEAGDWYVSHTDLDPELRSRLKGAAMVYRHEDFVIGLMPADIDNF